MHWQTRRFRIDLTRPRVMGIVNVTPDSFSDGGRYSDATAAQAHCDRLVEQGADMLDLGAVSTRPGSSQPTVEEELARLLPVLRHAVSLKVPVSVDTSRAAVIEQALDLGADIINDVQALRLPGALETVARHKDVGLCLMHMQGDPASMQQAPQYGDVASEVAAFLSERASVTEQHGIAHDCIVLDPGYGFGKTLAHNLALLARQHELAALGYPILAGWSRKSSLGMITGRAVEDRLVASVAAALASVQRGARIVRVHDVPETVDALKVWHAAGLGATA